MYTMFVEKRKSGKSIKYYLVHSFKDQGKVKKIRRYLGQDLSEVNLEKNKKRAEQMLLQQIEELKTEIFNFKLTENDLLKFNKFHDKLEIFHLDLKDWQHFTEEFVYNTNAIEGSTVLQDEVKQILDKKVVSKNPEIIETQNVADAIKFIKETKDDMSLNLILKLHEICFKNTKEFAGKLRDVEVVIKNPLGEVVHRGAPKDTVLSELEELVSWYMDHKEYFKPLVLAAIIHNQFEHIHPFQDGNGRIGRLLLNYILIKNGYPPINIRLEDRAKYYKSLQDYSKENNLKSTLEFLVDQYNKFKNEVTKK